MTRVLHVLAPGLEGGLERVVTMLAIGQSKRAGGVHVASVLSPPDGADHPFVARLSRAGIPVTPILVGARDYWREYRELRAVARAVRPDVVHTHGYRADAIGGIVAHRAGIPTISTVHGFTGGSRRNRLNERVQFVALRHADGVIAVSRPLVDRLAAAGVPRHRIHYVTNGFMQGVPPLGRDEARARLGIPADALVAGWIGRLANEKGPDVMLDALATTDTAWRLSMVGDGREMAGLRQRAAALGLDDRITWHGSVADAGAHFSAFDAFVLSSRTEGTPIALLEAMAARVPIIATRVGGVPDVVTEREALLVTSERPDAIAAALALLRGDPEGARRRSDLAIERLRAGFGEEAWLDAMERAYDATRQAGTRPVQVA